MRSLLSVALVLTAITAASAQGTVAVEASACESLAAEVIALRRSVDQMAATLNSLGKLRDMAVLLRRIDTAKGRLAPIEEEGQSAKNDIAELRVDLSIVEENRRVLRERADDGAIAVDESERISLLHRFGQEKEALETKIAEAEQKSRDLDSRAALEQDELQRLEHALDDLVSDM